MQSAVASVRDHIERLMPPAGRQRRVVGWGVLAWTAIGLVVLLWVAIRILAHVAGVLPYVVVAGAVVVILEPLVRRLTSVGLPRRLAATVAFLVGLALVALVLALLIPTLLSQARNLSGSSPALVRRGGDLFHTLSRSHNALLSSIGTTALGWIDRHAGSTPRFLETITGAGLRLAHLTLYLVVGAVLGFLALLSLPEAARGAAALIPPSSRATVGPTLSEVRRIVGGYVRARLIVSAVVGALATVGLWAIHMPFWLLLGLIVGVANTIPMLGSWIGGIPVAMVALATKPPSFLLVVLAVVVFAHAVDGYFLSPVVLKETTDLHPVVILLAVLVGADVFGFWGILVAIPVVGVAQYVLRELVLPRWTRTGPVAESVPAEGPPSGPGGSVRA